MVGEELIQRWVRRLRHEVPDAVAVFLGGSYVRGDAGPFSDVDFDVLVPDGPRDEWPAWLDVEGQRLVRVEVWIRDVERWLASRREPQPWAFELPSTEPLRLCWAADDSWRERLDRPQLEHPAGAPELDHFISDLGKLANAHSRGDELGLRLAAHDLASSCPALLWPLNPHPPVASRRAALLAALAAHVAPPGYRDDMVVCLGLAARPASGEAVREAACRLGIGVVELLESHADTYSELLSRELWASLTDGGLRRYAAQLVGILPPCPRLNAGQLGPVWCGIVRILSLVEGCEEARCHGQVRSSRRSRSGSGIGSRSAR